jgi:hypothetical protein
MSFAALKKTSGKQSLETIQKQAEAANKSPNVDDRFWKPSRDKAGNGFAVIRFLPSTDMNVSWTEYWHHAFKGPTGQWYIEKCLSTIKQDDPVNEYNSILYNSTQDKESAARKQVSQQKRKLNYVSNILVISDPSAPENEGKVFLYRYGKKIFDKIMDSMQPDEYDKEAVPVNPFDLWVGADFKLKIRTVDRFPNYDKSEFSPAAAAGTDEELEETYGRVYSLDEFRDPKTYKTYSELKSKLERVLNLTSKGPSLADQAKLGESEQAPAMREAEPAQAPVADAEGEDDESASYFSRLAEED